MGTWIVSSNSLKIEQRSNPSLAWLMPSDKFWGEDEVMLESPEVNITTKNIEDFYVKQGFPDNVLMYRDVKDLVHDLTPPGVEVFCLHGSGVPTTDK